MLSAIRKFTNSAFGGPSTGTGRGNPVVTTTAQMFPGFGERGVKPNKFVREHSTRSFRSWVYIAAMLNANAFAGVPLRLYARKRPGRNKYFQSRPVPRRRKLYMHGEFAARKEHPSKIVMQKIASFGDDFEEVTTAHPALQMLSQVNPWQNGFELSTLRLLYLQLTGNAYIYPLMDEGLRRPVELWPMPSQWTQAIPSSDGLIGGYTYGRSPDLVTFDTEEVMRWALPSLDDPYYGMSKTQAVWGAIGLSESKAQVDKALFDNMGRPDWLLLAKSGATGENLDRLEAQVDGKLRGKHNSGRFLVAGGDVQAVKLNFTPDELGDQERVIEEIANGFGVPISKLLQNHPNRSNAETGDTGWMRDTILPYCRMDEETLNAAYLPLFGIDEDAVLVYDNPVPVNEQAESTRLGGLVTSNILVPNDARQELGYESVPWGDQPVALMNKPESLSSIFGSLTGRTPGQDATPAGGELPPPEQVGTPTAAQETQLNGAQITSALAIVVAVVAGELPRDSALGMLQQLFGLTSQEAEKMLGSAGTDTPTTPNPNSAAAQERPLAQTPPPGPPALPNDPGTAAPRKQLALPEPAAEASVVNTTDDGRARPLPDGAKLIPLLQAMFKSQRAAVFARLGRKSLADVEAEFVVAVRAADPNSRLAADATGPAVHAFRRGVVKQMIAARRKETDEPPRDPLAPPPPELPTSFVSLDKWTKDLTDECRPIIEAIAKDEGRALLTKLGASEHVFSVFEQNIPAAAQAATLKFCEATNATTSLQLDAALSQLRDEIQVGLVSGDTYAELEDRVAEVFDNAEQFRAERIARTEGARAAHTGELVGAKESGVVSTKSWLLSEDACPVCEELAAIGAIPLDRTFAEYGGDYGSIDGPPAHPNCVCSLTYGIEDPEPVDANPIQEN